MIAKLKTYVAIAGAVALALLFAWWKGQSAGRAVEQAKAAVKEREDVATVNEVRTVTKGLSNEKLDEELSKWTKPN
jgi:hypothetical protein